MPKDPKAKKNKHLSLILRIIVAAGAIVWVFHGQDWQKVGEILRGLNLWYLGLGLGGFFVGQLICAFRWWGLLRTQSIHLSIAVAIRLYLLGLFYNNVMPGAVGGDLVKGWYVTKHTHRRLEGALSVLIDRLVGLAGMLLMALVAYVLFVRGQAIETVENQSSESQGLLAGQGKVILGVFIGLCVVIALLFIYPVSRKKCMSLASWALNRIAGLTKRTKDAIVVYCSRPLAMLQALGLTLISQSLVIVSFYFLGHNLGIEAGPKYYFVILPITWVVGAIPISPAGVGILEASFVGLFIHLAGASDESALALAFCQRFVWVLASLPGGAIHLMGAHLPKHFFVDVENPVN